MTPSDPSATLQAIKDRAGVVAKLGPPRPGGDLINAAHRSAADVPRLVAALEAVLKLHRKQDKPVRSWDLELRCEAHDWTRLAVGSFDVVRDCPHCSYRDYYVCSYQDCRDEEWPCPTVRAIAAELGREGGGGA